MHIIFGTRKIEYSVRFEPKPYFRVTISVDGDVSVVVPEGKTDAEIAGKVRKKVDWIIRQQNDFERFRPSPTPRSFVSGETHYYLGRQYRLRIIESTGKPQVRLKGKFFEVSVLDCGDTKKIEQLLSTWYREHAKKYFQEQLAKGLKKMKHRGMVQPVLTVRAMRRRWGSCTKNGKILLNLDLIKTPSDCIEYVVFHELCHLIEHNHTDKFYRLLSSAMPNWKKVKEKLEGACWLTQSRVKRDSHPQ